MAQVRHELSNAGGYMRKWEAVADDPRFTFGKLGTLIRAMVGENGSDGSTRWVIADFRDGTDRRNLFAGGWAETTEHAKRAAEDAASGYARKAGRPPLSAKALSSTQRNRLRLERLIAKAAAAGLADEKLSTLYYWLRANKQAGIALSIEDVMQQVEAIIRKSALTAFSTYCARATKLLYSGSSTEHKNDAEDQVEQLVERIHRLSKSANRPVDGHLPDGRDIYKEFTQIVNHMKQYGFIAESSLESAVRNACYAARMPGPQYADGKLRTVYEPADDCEATENDTILSDTSKEYGELFGKENEYRDDLMFHLLTQEGA